MGDKRIKHGMSRTRLHQCWRDMKQRCRNPKNQFYYCYGGRGITYCNEWEEFIPFMRWALANGYDETLTLERINNDGNYEPNNCTWATQQEQSLNKKHMPNKLGHPGIRRHGRGYAAEVVRNQKYNYVGTFDTIEEAVAARNKFIVSKAWL